MAACEKLAAAFAVKHEAVEGASKTFWEALKADGTKLDEACPPSPNTTNTASGSTPN